MFARYNKSVNNKNVYQVTSCPMKQVMIPLTSAISFEKPRSEDIQKSEELHRVLEAHMVFEPEHGTKRRQEVLNKLTTLFKDWIKTIAAAKGVSVVGVSKLGGLVMPFGSYRLGVHQSGADIDALCVAPRCIERVDYFASFFPLLASQPEVNECRSVEGAFVPVIKMIFDGIEVDLVFARLLLKEIPNDLDVSDDNILRNMDERCVRSLNGLRVTDAILNLIPNADVFREALRAIKLWAKKSGVYSNALGYFGGVTWAMLVARTCQLHPNAAASTIVHKMFEVFSQWKWPLPVLLTRADNTASLPFPMWNPRINISDRTHLMPIITPTYPQQNSTFNVTLSTRKVIVTELFRGFLKTKKIMEGRCTWDRLFETPSFFGSYRHFIILEVNSNTAADHVEWRGLIECKSRLLIANLENSPYVTMAHINPKSFDARKTNATSSSNTTSEVSLNCNATTATAPFSSRWFIGLEFGKIDNKNIELTDPIHKFVSHVNRFAKKIDMLKAGMSVNVAYVKRKNLDQYLDLDVLKRDCKLMQPLSTLLQQTNAGKKNIDSQNKKKVGKRPSDDESCNPAKLQKKGCKKMGSI